jgi:hypothetical protein
VRRSGRGFLQDAVTGSPVRTKENHESLMWDLKLSEPWL